MTETPDPDDLTAIRNIGPALAAELTRAGIPTASALRRIGAHDAYRRMLATGTQPHFIGYYVLHMALQGRRWNDCKGAEKDALRADFDALKAEPRDGPPAGIERDLDMIGTGLRRAAS